MRSGSRFIRIQNFVRRNIFPTGGDRLSRVALILANLLPLFGALFLGWDAGAIVLIYWSENVVAGFYGILKIALLRMEKPVEHLGKLFIVPFFCIHYGGFCAVHGMFLIFLFKYGGATAPMGPPGAWPGPLVFIGLLVGVFAHIWRSAPDVIVWPFIALMISHGVSFVQNYLMSGERSTREPQNLMIDPYKRVVALHVAIIAGGILTMVLGSPRPLMVILVLLKTALDLFFHNQSHKPKPPVSSLKKRRRRRRR